MHQSLPPREFPKLPITLFEDPRPDGALATIATRLAAIKRSDPNLRAFEWSNPGARRFNLENLQIIRTDLIQKGLLKVPVVAAHPSCGPDRELALEAARKLSATVVEDPGAIPAHFFWGVGRSGAEGGAVLCCACRVCWWTCCCSVLVRSYLLALTRAPNRTHLNPSLSADDPSVTHLLYPNGALCTPEDDQASQMRTLQTL